MPETKNALAELAERLSSNKVELVEGDEFPIRLSREAVIDFRKARRIVAELAKVKDVNDVYRLQLVKRPNQDQALAAIVTCRAIAEEGAKDGK